MQRKYTRSMVGWGEHSKFRGRFLTVKAFLREEGIALPHPPCLSCDKAEMLGQRPMMTEAEMGVSRLQDEGAGHGQQPSEAGER